MDRVTLRLEFERIRSSHGTLTPELVVNEARSPTSPLHGSFEWDDSLAAEQWRHAQARNLIRTILITVTVPNRETMIVPVYASEPVSGKDREYSPVVEILSNSERRVRHVKEVIGRARDVLRNCPDKLTQRLADELDKRIRKL